MKQMIKRNDFDEKIKWDASREPMKQATEPKEDVESPFYVDEIEAI